jgi:hypothetical protein
LASLSGKKKPQKIMADLAPPRGKSAKNRKIVARKVGRLWSDVREGFGLAHFSNGCSFLMISPNLHDIWVVFFLNLSQELKLVHLLYFGTLGDGYSLKGSKK